MHVHHIAIWTSDLERLRAFYQTYFGAQSGALYSNPAKQYTSYFLSFADGARLELMSVPVIQPAPSTPAAGLAHLAFSTGSAEGVDRLTRRLQQDGYTLASAPRTTGDGYYESVVLDPDGNRVEITI